MGEREREMMIEMARLTKERDEALSREARLAIANKALAGDVTRGAGIESERDALRGEVKRLREALNAGIGTHGDPCSKGEDCQFMRDARAALASGGDRG